MNIVQPNQALMSKMSMGTPIKLCNSFIFCLRLFRGKSSCNSVFGFIEPLSISCVVAMPLQSL
jgi:hypothetical protein